MSVLTRVIKCPLCKRRRECKYVNPVDFGSKGKGSLWCCTACGSEFGLRPALTASLLDEEVSDA